MDSKIILHADDFGLNAVVNQGILRGFDAGLLTSTSLLANAPAANDALAGWKSLARLAAIGQLRSAERRRQLADHCEPFDLGVHLNLTQGRPLTGEKYPAYLLDREGRFPGVLRLFTRLQLRGSRFLAAIRDELRAQIAFVVDRGFRPSHLNGHQYVELMPTVAAVLPGLQSQFQIATVRVAREPALGRTAWQSGRLLAWPLAAVKRYFADRIQTRDARPTAFFGTAHAGLIDLATIKTFLENAGISRSIEVGMHPGAHGQTFTDQHDADGWTDPLAARRPNELALLESAALAKELATRAWSLARLSRLQTVRERAAA